MIEQINKFTFRISKRFRIEEYENLEQIVKFLRPLPIQSYAISNGSSYSEKIKYFHIVFFITDSALLFKLKFL